MRITCVDVLICSTLGLSPSAQLLLVTQTPRGFLDPSSTLFWIRRPKLKLTPEKEVGPVLLHSLTDCYGILVQPCASQSSSTASSSKPYLIAHPCPRSWVAFGTRSLINQYFCTSIYFQQGSP